MKNCAAEKSPVFQRPVRVWQTWGMKKTISLDLRERILAAYDDEEGTREAVARRFRVSLGLVKKLLQQRRRLGDIRPQHHRSGSKPRIVASHQHQLRVLLAKKPDLTLKELRAATGLACTLPAIHYVLVRLGLTYKKRRSGPVSKTAPTSAARGESGGGSRPALIRRGWSSSTNRVRKPI
jgi:transposase